MKKMPPWALSGTLQQTRASPGQLTSTRSHTPLQKYNLHL